jgi:hypothetical protein
MSVLASKRKESREEAIAYSLELYDMLIEFMQRSFAVKIKNSLFGNNMQPEKDWKLIIKHMLILCSAQKNRLKNLPLY